MTTKERLRLRHVLLTKGTLNMWDDKLHPRDVFGRFAAKFGGSGASEAEAKDHMLGGDWKRTELPSHKDVKGVEASHSVTPNGKWLIFYDDSFKTYSLKRRVDGTVMAPDGFAPRKYTAITGTDDLYENFVVGMPTVAQAEELAMAAELGTINPKLGEVDWEFYEDPDGGDYFGFMDGEGRSWFVYQSGKSGKSWVAETHDLDGTVERYGFKGDQTSALNFATEQLTSIYTPQEAIYAVPYLQWVDDEDTGLEMFKTKDGDWYVAPDDEGNWFLVQFDAEGNEGYLEESFTSAEDAKDFLQEHYLGDLPAPGPEDAIEVTYVSQWGDGPGTLSYSHKTGKTNPPYVPVRPGAGPFPTITKNQDLSSGMSSWQGASSGIRSGAASVVFGEGSKPIGYTKAATYTEKAQGLAMMRSLRDEAPLSERRLTRGIKVSGDTKAQLLATCQTGMLDLPLAGFTSSEKVSGSFGKSMSGGTWVFVLEPGAPVIYPNSFTGSFTTEVEFITGGRFRVSKIEVKGNDVRVHLEHLALFDPDQHADLQSPIVAKAHGKVVLPTSAFVPFRFDYLFNQPLTMPKPRRSR